MPGYASFKLIPPSPSFPPKDHLDATARCQLIVMEFPTPKKTLDNIKNFLTQGARVLGINDKNSLLSCLEHGRLLNLAFDMFNLEKFNKQITCTWGEWMKSISIPFPTSYIRKLCAMASTIGKYPHFGNLQLSFHKLYTCKDQIENILNLNKDIAAFWSTP